MKTTPLALFLIIILHFQSCKKAKAEVIAKNSVKHTSKIEKPIKNASILNQNFNDYWYAGEAEISSYQLEQMRYGEKRIGKAVLVYVTEPFLEDKQVKADRNTATNIPVLKLNSTKKFNTGIYPYSIMQSTFYPVSNNQHALKVSCSVQEWCGHVYTQLNNKSQFNITSHSYFENEADQNFKLDKAILENEIWTQLRINPESLPIGNIMVIPSLEFIRLNHKKLKTYDAYAELNKGNYSLSFSELNRKLSINFNTKFPYDVLSWEETINGSTTKATKLKTFKSAYWSKNSKSDEVLRKTLQLE